MGLKFLPARRLAVLRVGHGALERLEQLHSLLRVSGARYVFRCSGGRCHSFLEGGDASVLEAVVSLPDITVSECRHGGCPESLALLPPPPLPVPPRPPPLPNPVDGVLLGYAGEAPVRIGLGDLFRHTAVVGSTGSGKTHTAARIAGCASAEGLEVTVLDWHNEYPRLLGGMEPATALPEVTLVDPETGGDEAVTLIEGALGLSPQQAFILAGLLEAATTSSAVKAGERLEGLLASLDPEARAGVRQAASILAAARDARGLLAAARALYAARAAAMSKGEAEVWAALIRRLAILGSSKKYSRLIRIVKEEDEPRKEGWGERRRLLVVTLSEIPSPGLRRLYALLLLQRILIEARRHPREQLLVVDEAYNLIPQGDWSSPLEVMLSEARKYKLGVVLVLHTPQVVTDQMMANINNLVIHRIASPRDAAALARILPGEEEHIEAAKRLPPGYALVCTASMEEPAVAMVEGPGGEC